MIISEIRKKIIINFTVCAVFALVIAILLFYSSKHKKSQDAKIQFINELASQAKSKASEYQSKTEETKKYMEIWKDISDRKKSFDGIKIDDVNSLLNKLSEKYYISNQSIKVSLPENLKDGVFDRKSLAVAYAIVSISFTAIDDEKAILFLSDFLGSLIGYVVVTDIDIKKNRKYSDQDLVDISSNKINGAILVKFEFAWYVYRKKEEENKPLPNIKNTNIAVPDFKGSQNPDLNIKAELDRQ